MKIVEPSVILVHHTPDPERVIERMGRICYQSSHKTKECAAFGWSISPIVCGPPTSRRKGQQ